MGLLTGLLTLPLAPVRGTVWIAEQLQEQAEAEQRDEASIHAALLQLEALRESGELDEDEITAAEDELILQLVEIRSAERAPDR
jgi:hypothetical protein